MGWQSAMIFATILLAAFVQSTTGFAFAVIIMSIWPLFFPVVEASQLMMFGSGLTVFTMAFRYRRHINFRVIWLPLILALVGTALGTIALVSVRNALAVRAFGIVLVLLAIYLIFFSQRVKVPRSPWTAAAAGVVSGLLGGFLTIPGPPMVLYYSVATDSKEEYLGTIQFFYVFLIVFRFAFLWIQRGLSRFVLTNAPIVVIASALGIVLGVKLLNKVSSKALRIMVYVLMTAAGIWYIVG